jgi:hypothetical protein
MKLSFTDLLAPVTLTGPHQDDALRSWRWLTGPEATPWLVTALGDVFVKADDGPISFLDTYQGSLQRAARANTDWTKALQDPGHLDQWFDPLLVRALRARGLTLGPEQCYSPILPLTLGGRMEPDNFEVTDWRVHAGLTGRIWRRLRDGDDSRGSARRREHGSPARTVRPTGAAGRSRIPR